MIQDHMKQNGTGKRSKKQDVMVADAPKDFDEFTLKKKIYGTGWHGTVKVTAWDDGRLRTTTDH